MRYLSAHAQHIGSRKYQQDAFEFSDPDDAAFLEHAGFLAIVCDGMGGMEHGDLASQTAVATMVAEYATKTPLESIPDALVRSVREANSRVLAIAGGLGVTEGMGSTLVAAVVHGGLYYFISVGDSALFHVRDGTAELVNRHHIFGNLLDRAAEIGTISREAAGVHPERESLTSFIGIGELVEIDRNPDPLALAGGDTLLLATDGLFKTLELAEIEAALRGHPQSWPMRLVAATLKKRSRGQDNVTVLSVTADTPGIEQHPGLKQQWKGQAGTAAAEDLVSLEPMESVAPAFVQDSMEGLGRRVSGKLAIMAIAVFVMLAIAAAIAGWWVGSRA
jgi:serine/threonine protein phosphatase PrpC